MGRYVYSAASSWCSTQIDGHLSVTAISDATPPQTRDSHASPWMRSAHIMVSPAVPTMGLP